MDEKMRDLFFQNYWQILYNYHLKYKRNLRGKGGDAPHIRVAAGKNQDRPLVGSGEIFENLQIFRANKTRGLNDIYFNEILTSEEQFFIAENF